MSAPASFKQADVTRAFKGAQAAGLRDVIVRIAPNGSIEIVPVKPGPSRASNSWDDVL